MYTWKTAGWIQSFSYQSLSVSHCRSFLLPLFLSLACSFDLHHQRCGEHQLLARTWFHRQAITPTYLWRTQPGRWQPHQTPFAGHHGSSPYNIVHACCPKFGPHYTAGGVWYRTLWGYFSLPPHQTSIFHLFHISPVTTTPIIYTHTFSSCLSFVPVFRCPRFHLATSISDHPWGLVNQLPWTWGYSCGDAYTGTREVAGIYRQVFGTTLACPNWGRIMPSLSRFILVVRLSLSLPHTHTIPRWHIALFFRSLK